MGNASVRINTAVVRNAAETVSRLNQGVNTSLDDLSRRMGGLNGKWDGSASDCAVSTFFHMRDDYYQNRYAQVENFVRFLMNNVAGGYEFAENNNRKLSDTFK